MIMSQLGKTPAFGLSQLLGFGPSVIEETGAKGLLVLHS